MRTTRRFAIGAKRRIIGLFRALDRVNGKYGTADDGDVLDTCQIAGSENLPVTRHAGAAASTARNAPPYGKAEVGDVQVNAVDPPSSGEAIPCKNG